MNFTNDVHNDVQNMSDFKSPTVKSRMTSFQPATADQVRKIIHLAKRAILIRSLLSW